MMGLLRTLLAGDLVRSVLIGALAWLMSKAWDLQAQRLRIYGDIAVELASPAEQEAQMDAQLARLAVAAPTQVAKASEALRRLPRNDPRWPAARDRLIIAMRRDTALWTWINPTRWDPLDPKDLAP